MSIEEEMELFERLNSLKKCRSAYFQKEEFLNPMDLKVAKMENEV